MCGVHALRPSKEGLAKEELVKEELAYYFLLHYPTRDLQRSYMQAISNFQLSEQFPNTFENEKYMRVRYCT